MPGVGTLEELERAIDETDVDGLVLDTEPSALDAARRSLEESGLLLLGEVHGVQENPLIIRALMRRLELRGLGLEWHEELSQVVGSFASGAPLKDHPWLWSGDGRITAGHLALLRALAAAGSPGPLLFDVTMDAGADWSDRDLLMAQRILAADAAEPRLIVAGNLHTRLAAARAAAASRDPDRVPRRSVLQQRLTRVRRPAPDRRPAPRSRPRRAGRAAHRAGARPSVGDGGRRAPSTAV
jgi:hypothetical protein